MSGSMIVVLDVGKTAAKVTLWAADGKLVRREVRPNARQTCEHYACLDILGIEAWLADVFTLYARLGHIGAIIPVAHGAAAAIVRGGQLAAPVMDYESSPPAAVRKAYLEQCDDFAETGSPPMGMALNLGLQLHWIAQCYRDALAGDAQIVPWPQYWAWLLSGVAASEVTSLGSHTDLWAPGRNAPSAMAVRRGWAQHLAPLRAAHEALGPLTPEWAARTGLARDTLVHVGLHDSNAALCAARAYPEFAASDATLVSTGTWFVSMRSLANNSAAPTLPANRGCLFNVDVRGCPAPTALFMGGREAEMLSHAALDQPDAQSLLLRRVAACVETGAMILPTMAPGTGPFPDAVGTWINEPSDEATRSGAICLYLALMTDVALELIGAEGAALVEGRFAKVDAMMQALAALRPNMAIYASSGESDVSLGALRLLRSDLAPASALQRIEPLDIELADYKARWRAAISAR
ncbi:MAG: hypothetical protein R3C27_15260 [Hyphomonadaceae bacterium]